MLKKAKVSTPWFAHFSPAFSMGCCHPQIARQASENEVGVPEERRLAITLPDTFRDYLLLRPILTSSSVASA